MSKTATRTSGPKTGTLFSCHAPKAGAVCVGSGREAPDQAGGRDVGGDPRRAEGRHEYKFVVDGEWCCEPGCDGINRDCPKCVPNAFGTMNRVIEVT